MSNYLQMLKKQKPRRGYVKVKSLQDRPPTSHQMEFMGPLQNGLVRSFCKWVTGVINPISGV